MCSQAVPNKTTMIRIHTILNFVLLAFVLSFALKTNNEPLFKESTHWRPLIAINRCHS